MTEKKKIFIADDDEIVLEGLKKLLVLSSFEVESTTNAKEVVSLIRYFKPQVILLDLLMPEVSGFEICEMLNRDRETQDIPIIVTSALGDYLDVKRAYQLGVIGYFTKPYDFTQLLKEIEKVIAYKEGKRT